MKKFTLSLFLVLVSVLGITLSVQSSSYYSDTKYGNFTDVGLYVNRVDWNTINVFADTHSDYSRNANDVKSVPFSIVNSMSCMSR